MDLQIQHNGEVFGRFSLPENERLTPEVWATSLATRLADADGVNTISRLQDHVRGTDRIFVDLVLFMADETAMDQITRAVGATVLES